MRRLRAVICSDDHDICIIPQRKCRNVELELVNGWPVCIGQYHDDSRLHRTRRFDRLNHVGRGGLVSTRHFRGPRTARDRSHKLAIGLNSASDRRAPPSIRDEYQRPVRYWPSRQNSRRCPRGTRAAGSGGWKLCRHANAAGVSARRTRGLAQKSKRTHPMITRYPLSEKCGDMLSSLSA